MTSRTCATARGWGGGRRERIMTTNADFKALVRARMAQTGQSYTQARADLLAQQPAPEPDPFVERTVRSFFDGERLRSIPTKRRARVAVLLHLLLRFEAGRTYTEPEVNEILRTAHDDVASLRRNLVEYGYLQRPGGVYSVVTSVPERSPDEAQEVPRDEAARLAAVPRARG